MVVRSGILDSKVKTKLNSRIQERNERSSRFRITENWLDSGTRFTAEVQAFSTEMWTIWWTTQGTNQRAWPSLDRRIRSRLVQHLELELWRTKTRRILEAIRRACETPVQPHTLLLLSLKHKAERTSPRNSMISWQRLSCWFKTVATCPNLAMWETRSCSALILTSWERNLSPKETTSHSKKAREIAGTDEATKHIPLDEVSSYLTTFSTLFSRYPFKRLPLILALLFHKTCFKNSSTKHLKAADDKFVYGSSEVEASCHVQTWPNSWKEQKEGRGIQQRQSAVHV